MIRSSSQILHDMDPARPDTIQALIDYHRRTFGGFVMAEDGKDRDDLVVRFVEPPDEGKSDDGKSDEGKSDDGKHPYVDVLGEAGKKALKAERDARQALERQIAEMKSSQIDPKKLAEAFGIKPEDAKSSGDDMVATLQKQVSDMQQETRLFRIVAKHQITDDDDIDLLRSIGDEQAMEKLATRLAKASSRDGKDDEESDEKRRRRPRSDKSQGQSWGGNNRPGSVAQVIEDRRAAREAKK